MPSAVKAFYEATGGDYADAVARFSSEAPYTLFEEIPRRRQLPFSFRLPANK